MRGDPERRDDPNGCQQAERVPVSERGCETVLVDTVDVRVESILEETRGQGVSADQGSSDQDAPNDTAPVATAEDKRYGERDRDVHEHPLDLAHGRRGADRPR